MSQATRPNDRHIIWSNQNLDVDDWREDYKEFLEANELDDDPNDEQALYEWMEETNYDYLSDERVNLNVQLSQPIIVIGDIGRWNGRVMGYKDIPSGNIRDCLYADTDYTEWYVDILTANKKRTTSSWEQRKLSELTSMHARIGWQYLRTSEFLDSGNYMLITGTDFNDGAINFSTCHYVERERYEQDRNIQIHNGSILITKDGTLGKVAYVQGLSMPATLNAGVFNVQIKDANNADEKYLFQ